MKKYGFTLVELLVVIAVIALLMAILLPALNRAREMGKRAVCLHHLQQLFIAWTMYADGNNDKIVRGDAGEYGWHPDETEWVLRDWGSPPMSIEQQKESIMKGALYRYTKSIDVYRCPTVEKHVKLRTYSAVDSMNSTDSSYMPAISPAPTTIKAVMIKVRQTMRKPYERIVFIDDGGLGNGAMGGFTIHIYKDAYLTNSKCWWDEAPIRHGEGSTFVFADGHAEYHKWMDKQTIAFSKGEISNPCDNDGNEDMRWFSLCVWGSPPVDRE